LQYGFKNAKFAADLKPLENLQKSNAKKLSTKQRPKNGVVDSYYCVQKFSAYNFLHFKAKIGRNGSKNEKRIFINVS
jgi:hypothetical protein